MKLAIDIDRMVEEMRVVIQRVQEARVEVEGKVVGKIGVGMLLLVGFTDGDSASVCKKMADKIAGLRIFEDTNQKMNVNLSDVGGAILSVSQFTLYADCRKGRRPSFDQAARPEVAVDLYQQFNEFLREYDFVVESGIFQSDMKVYLMNDGPVTIILDSNDVLSSKN